MSPGEIGGRGTCSCPRPHTAPCGRTNPRRAGSRLRRAAAHEDRGDLQALLPDRRELTGRGSDRLAAEANRVPGSASCPKWDAIERLYLARAAVLPVFDSDHAMLSRDARFASNGLTLIAASIRMIG